MRCQAAPAPPQHLPNPEHVNFHSIHQISDQTPRFSHHFLWGINQLAVRLQNPMVAHSSTQTFPVSLVGFTNPSQAPNTLTHKKMANSQQPKYTVIFIKYYEMSKILCQTFLFDCMCSYHCVYHHLKNSHMHLLLLCVEKMSPFLCILQLRADQCIFTSYISSCVCVFLLYCLLQNLHT